MAAAVGNSYLSVDVLRTHIPDPILQNIENRVHLTASAIFEPGFVPQENPQQDMIRRYVWFEWRSGLTTREGQIEGPIVVLSITDYKVDFSYAKIDCCGCKFPISYLNHSFRYYFKDKRLLSGQKGFFDNVKLIDREKLDMANDDNQPINVLNSKHIEIPRQPESSCIIS